MTQNKINSKVFFIIISILLGLSTIYLSAQDNKSIKDKIDNLKGEPKLITIETGSDKVVLKEEEAKELLKMLKAKKQFVFEKEFSFSPDSMDKKMFVIRKGKYPPKDFFWIDESEKDDNKNIEVEKKDGKTTVTITTNDKGEEKVEVLTGKEAEEFLEQEKQTQKIKIRRPFPPRMNNRCGCCCMNREDDIILFGENEPLEFFSDDDVLILGDDEDKNFMKVIVKEENGEKVITVESVENGKKKTEIFKGKEAEQYLKKMENDNQMKIDEDFKDGKKIKKIIIKK